MGIFRRILALGKRSELDRENEDELRDHVQMRTEANLAKGMSLEQAARAARLRFGNPTVLKERVGAEDAALNLESLFRDVRYALRGFSRSPGFTTVAILTLALGIGANTAVFQLLDAVRLRSLPIQKPEELAELRIVGGNRGIGITDSAYANFTIPMWQEIRLHHDPFSGVFAWRQADMAVGPPNEEKHVNGLEVSREFFNVLGVLPLQGRLIEPQDEGGCELSKVVASYPFWKTQMGGQPITPSTTILVEGHAVQVLGVTPPSFFGVVVGDRFDLAYPTCTPPNPRREAFNFSVMGRLKPGWDMDRASGYFNSLSPGVFESSAPTNYSPETIKTFKSFRLAAYPAGAGVSRLRDAYDSSLQLLLAITGLVLLIACANLANLMLARATARQREMAIRMALGASRRRMLRQLLIESSLLAISGASLGIALAQPLSRLLVASLGTSQYSIHLAISTDWRVLLFAAVVAALTCVIFGTVPAMRGANADPIASLKSGERGVIGSRERFSIQRLMVIMQIAVSMVLLVGALLFVRSYRNLMTLNLGMRENGITIAYFGFPALNIKPENQAEFKRQLMNDVRSIPGIQDAAATTNIPMSGTTWGHEVHVGAIEGGSRFTYADPHYFSTMGIPLLTGRAFTDADTNSSQFVLIVNQAFLRKYLSTTQPLGQLVHVMPEPHYPERTYQIIGTIPDTRYSEMREDSQPIAYVPAAQLPLDAQDPRVSAMIATSIGPDAIVALRHNIEAKYPNMSLQFFDFQQEIRDGLVGDRMMAMLSGFFGVLAALLVAVGLYGVLSYFITRRRNEIGIRIALGAKRGQVIALIMRDTAAMLLVGIVLGTGLALLAGRAATAMLFGLKAYDLATLAFAIVLLAFIAVLASWLPALKASNLDPVAALRSE
ncbi:ABC transporter permease [Acidicapsa ligni]|uniref:ABC transporter permease n=1 Tax=Acidicapsa ligni TaxID=542300 RepID=UPI0021DF4772|nr:ABC transporter permease [Acidicapsa ligni]